ncbi:MAG: glycerol-3-phosphate dehydrogenase/oxidase, partial [Burkholderiales bacterium]|nr:glycerol-3-phosphate dehydrogenase/oxidase [Phycisphaerae bacterium]
MNRQSSLQRIQQQQSPWDILIIGGGATGIGIAVDAASRGYSVCLFEQSDFGKGTSSRSTKLVHGGVRYLRQGNLALVFGALRERAILRRNAPHLVHDMPFIVPSYGRLDSPFYWTGLKLYDLLSLGQSFGKSELLSRQDVLTLAPTIEPKGLRGGVMYHDGQFDDARLLISLAQTADAHGAALLNYAPVVRLLHDSQGKVRGVDIRDLETGQECTIASRCVINATGAFVDAVRRLDDPASSAMIAPSQGTHIVLPRSFLPGDTAIMVPKTPDGRVMFAVPWNGQVVVGTTDTPVIAATIEPVAQQQEINFILETAGRYLAIK